MKMTRQLIVAWLFALQSITVSAAELDDTRDVYLTVEPPENLVRIGPLRGAATTRPAGNWPEAFLTGNGRLGAMMYGRPYDETVVINHCRLYLPKGSRELLPDLEPFAKEFEAAALKAGKNGPAVMHRLITEKLKENGQGGLIGTDPFHPAFLLNLTMAGTAAKVKNYLMTEDFQTGELAVRWTDEQGDWERKVFASRPDNVVVISITGPKSAVGCDLGLDISHPLVQPEIGVEPGWIKCHAVYVKGKGGYDSVVRVIADGGGIKCGNDRLSVTNADKMLIIIRVQPWKTPLPATESEAWAYSPKHPDFVDDHKTNLLGEMQASLSKLPADYAALLKPHARVHGELFSRVSLDLGGGADRGVLSEALLDRAATENRMPPALMEKMYDACRYLTICSTGRRPPNLQGIWTGTWKPAWSGDYTLDSNLQLEVTSMMTANLPELMEPYFRLVESWLPDCRTNARKLYGCRGILTNARASNTCLLLHTVGWVGDQYIAGGGWLAHFFYDYYLFTGDKDFLEKRAVPLLKEVALFYEDLLDGSEGPDGKYRFFVSYSPEVAMGTANATFDIAVARETLTNLISACTELGIEGRNVPKWRTMLSKMPPYLVGEDGALQEWSWEGVENGPGTYNHRHHSSLYPLYQSYEFSPEETPDLWKAAAVAVDKKAEHWLRGPRPNSNNITHGMVNHGECAARLGRGEVVHEILARMATKRYLLPSMMFSYWPNRKGFGFDAPGAIPNIVNNSLAFSWQGTLDLLPALPSAWPKGSISGILARGRIRIDRLAWDKPAGRIDLTLTSGIAQTVTLRLPPGTRIISATVARPDALLRELADAANSRQLTLPPKRPIRVKIVFTD